MAGMIESQEERIARLIREQRQQCAQFNPVQDYAHRTAYSCAAAYPSPPPRKTDDEIKISVLRDENEKLKAQYSDLVKKTTILLEAYKKLETENETLKKKKAKQDSWANAFAGIGKTTQNAYQKFLVWLKT